MAITCQAPVQGDKLTAVQFPAGCVGCGAPVETHSALTVSRLIMRGGKQMPLIVRLDVPHCRRCARADAWIFRGGMIAALLGFLLVGGAVFGFAFAGSAWLGLDAYARPQDQPSLLLGAFFGLLAGLAGALLFEAAARPVLLPFVGRAALRAPLLIMQFLADSDYVAGLTGALSADGTVLRLIFDSDASGAEFTRLNRE